MLGHLSMQTEYSKDFVSINRRINQLYDMMVVMADIVQY